MRRRHLFIAPLAAACSSAWAQADGFPSRPLRLVIPYAAGGIADLLGRLVAEKLGAQLKQTVVIENRPGAGGHVGGELVAKAAPDGYTLVLATIAHNGAASMYKGLKYDPSVDLVPASLIADSASLYFFPKTLRTGKFISRF